MLRIAVADHSFSCWQYLCMKEGNLKSGVVVVAVVVVGIQVLFSVAGAVAVEAGVEAFSEAW